LAAAGVPAGVMVAPLISGLNDHEVAAILKAAAEAGARHAGYVPLRLPGAVGPLFEAWLDRHEPGRKAKVLRRVRAERGGRLTGPRFGDRMRARGPLAEATAAVFHAACRREGLNREKLVLSTAAFRRPEPPGAGGRQLFLFE